MIFVGAMSKIYMQTKADVRFFFLVVPSSYWQMARKCCVHCVLVLTLELQNASYLLVFSLWETNEKAATACSADVLCQEMSGQKQKVVLPLLRQRRDCSVIFTLRRWRSTGTEQVKQRVTKAALRATHLHCILSPRPQSAFQLPAQHTERAHKCSWDTHITTHWWNTQRTGCRACAHFSFRNIYLGVDDSRTKPLQQWTFE